jgi:catechol 2,3-dioxygenase-like lactoylglutathione lyase family enzyme
MNQFQTVAPVIPVADVEKSIRWYGDVLGFDPTYINGEAPANYAVLRRDEVRVHLLLKSEARPGFDGRIDAQFWVRDVDKLHADIVAKGVPLFEPLQNRPWGHRDFSLFDPDGNKIWLSQALS